MNLEFREFPLYGPLFEGAVRVFSAAFSQPPYDPGELRDISALLRHNHANKPGLLRLVALAEGEIAGMGYGHHLLPEDDWWGSRVLANVSPETAALWLGDAFSVVELAVEPGQQRKGIGTALLLRLLERAESTAVLSTRTDSHAHYLYRRLGFEVLTEMRFDGAGPWFHIMGKRLR